MPLSLAAATRPTRRRSLAPHRERFSPLMSRVLVLVVLALPVARVAHPAEPRPVLVAMVVAVPACHWCWCARSAEPSLVLVAVVLARSRSLQAPTSVAGINRPQHFPPLCCICMFHLFLDVCCNYFILMLKK
jgi:hypothetical protein